MKREVNTSASLSQKELYCAFKDLQWQFKNKIQQICHICKEKAHVTRYCDKVQFIPNYRKISLKYGISQDVKDRQSCIRRSKSKNSLGQIAQVKYSVRSFKVNLLLKARPDFAYVIKQFIEEVAQNLDDLQF